MGRGGGSTDTGTISQSFATSAGGIYMLSFYLAGPQPGGFPDPRQVDVDINGAHTIFSEAASPNQTLVWGLKSMQFTATGPTTTLTFSSVNGAGYWGALIDNASVNANVPEPATAWLFAVALSAMLFMRSRRRRIAG